jgi:CubicO group peptidase (beta-lactamase class C family)
MRRDRTSRQVFLTGLSSIAVFGMVTRPFHVLASFLSRELCSAVFVSGLDPDQDYAEHHLARPGMRWLNWAIRYDVDRSKREVTASVLGLFRNRSVFREGLGTLLVRGPEPADPPVREADCVAADPTGPGLPEIAGPAVVEPNDPVLRAALDQAFAEPLRPPFRRTKVVVVVHAGRIVAERYAPGFGIRTPILGYSNAKSIISALIGILVGDGRLSVHTPAPILEWANPADRRHAITIDHLLRMTSGLAISDTNGLLGRVGRMLFLERDMAGYAARCNLHSVPGQAWEYTSGNTVILSRIVRDAVGGRAIDVLRFANRELFQPLGMQDVTVEFDATGTPIGSTYVFATARDWARFGMLYLNDGVVAGRRILPEGWVAYSSVPTLGTGYGAGFWTNRIRGEVPKWHIPWAIPGAPEDTISARGNMGQFVIVIPSKQLVIVRFGLSHTRDVEHEGVGRLVASVVAALTNAG